MIYEMRLLPDDYVEQAIDKAMPYHHSKFNRLDSLRECL